MENTDKKVEKKVTDKPIVPAVASSKEKAAAKSKAEKKVISEVKASARFIHMSPKKIRLVINQIRGLAANDAIDVLRFLNKGAVKPVTKLLNSALANAEHNFQISKEDLFIKAITANDGPTIKRFRPRARGSSAAIRKRTSHIELVLGVTAGAKKVAGKTDKNGKKEIVKIVNPDEIKKSGPKDSGKGSNDSGRKEKGFMKGMFQRKTG